jgi:hypothetical protein
MSQSAPASQWDSSEPLKSFNERAVSASLLAFAMLAYAAVLTNGFALWRPSGANELNLTFNSMLEHLLRGQYDVDPNIVGTEGYLRDGRVYAYWGVFCALLRLPLTLIPGGLQMDVTRFSCWVAVCVAAAAKLETLRLVRRESPPSPLRETVYWALALTILFAGAQIEFLRSSLYEEVCLWAGALAAIFVYLATRGILAGVFTRSALCGMAALAGLALLTRVSVAIGLYAALGLLLLTGLRRELSTRGGSASAGRSYIARLASGDILWPALVLLSFIVVTGWINYQRWGNPLTFVNLNLYLMNGAHPDWPGKLAAYGALNLTRIPFGLGYYFLPVWVLQRGDGHLLFQEHQDRLLDSTELPPGSFFLTDPLLLLLAAYGGWSLIASRRNLGIDRTRALAIACGFIAPCVLILTAIAMNFRYRMEFYPLIEFGAFLGFLALCGSARQTIANPMSGISVALAAAGILGSMLTLFLYKMSNFGSAIGPLHAGVYNYYALQVHDHIAQFREHFPRAGHWLAK